jgi:hypothetical protein
MDSSRDLLPEALRLLVAESGGPDAAGHPSPDELIAYSGRELQEPERLRIQRHLAECPGCATIVLDLEGFPDVELRDETLRRSDAEEAADWQAVRRRLEPPGPGTAPAASAASAPPVAQVPTRRRRPARWAELAAAALLAVALGLGLWAASLYRQVGALNHALSRPLANVFVADLMPSRVRSFRAESVLRLPAEAGQLVLILNIDDLRPFPDYQAEMLDGKGVVFWQQRGLRRGPEGNFSLSMPRSAIPAGPCQIRIFGLEGASKTLLATYVVQVASASPG